MTTDELKADIERARNGQRIVNSYHRTFNTPEGKAVIEDLKRFFNTDGPVFNSLKMDTHDAAVRDGQRQVIIRINEQLSKSVDADGNTDKPKTTIKK